MSWAEELYKVYETQEGIEHEDSENKLLKIGQSTKNAQLEITIDEHGEFIDAKELSFEAGKNTVYFVTDKSGARTSGITPLPFSDVIKYIAGDLSKFTSTDNSDYYDKYIEQLNSWRKSEFTHPSVEALYIYLSKKSVISDLLSVKDIIQLNDKGKLSDKSKIGGSELEKVFVRFVVQYSDLSRKQKTYEDDSLYECFCGFNKTLLSRTGFCNMTGKKELICENHPVGLRNSGDMTKLISANDDKNYSYLGRFLNKYEAVSVGYEYSQKMHNALKWLVQRQGNKYGDTTIIVWSSDMEKLPSITDSANDLMGDEYDAAPDTMPIYKEYLSKKILGRKNEIPKNSKVMIMGLDSTNANKGRLSISLYSELFSSDFYDNIEKWHTDTAVRRYSKKHNGFIINSIGVFDIINCAYGNEIEKKAAKKEKYELDTKYDIVSSAIHRLIPCITEGRPFPSDIMWTLYNRASNPLSFKTNSSNEQKGNNQNKIQVNNHGLTLETACGVIQKYYKDHKNHRKGEISMAYDPNECDRSYLYGCLLAIADAAERESYDEGDKYSGETNARRYWRTFSKRPYMTWQKIEEQLLPYFHKLKYKRVRYERMLQDVKGKFTAETFADNTALSPLYLLGFHHYTAEIYKSKKEKEN